MNYVSTIYKKNLNYHFKKKWEHHVTKPQTTHDESCFLANALHEYAYKLLHDFLHAYSNVSGTINKSWTKVSHAL